MGKEGKTSATWFKYVVEIMYVAYSVLLGRELERMSTDIKPYLQLGEVVKRGDWYLGLNYIGIRLYGIETTPYKMSKLLTPRLFMLEYLRQMVEVDDLHFIKSRKKGRIVFPISMGGYVLNDKRGIKRP